MIAVTLKLVTPIGQEACVCGFKPLKANKEEKLVKALYQEFWEASSAQ